NGGRGVVDKAANAPRGGADALGGRTQDAARNAKSTMGLVALKFSVTGDAAAVGGRVRGVLEEPIDGVERVLGRLPATALNERGAQFCRSFGAILAKYPFKQDAAGEATLA